MLVLPQRQHHRRAQRADDKDHDNLGSDHDSLVHKLLLHGVEPQFPGDAARVAEALKRRGPGRVRIIAPGAAKFALRGAFEVIGEFIENVAAKIRRLAVNRRAGRGKTFENLVTPGHVAIPARR